MEKEEKLKNYLLDNMEVLRDIVSEINGYNSSLDYLEVYENDEDFFNMFFEGNTIEAVRAVCYVDYNYTDNLVRFNSYGNLESCSIYDYDEELKGNIDDIIECLIDLSGNIYIYDKEISNILEEAEG